MYQTLSVINTLRWKQKINFVWQIIRGTRTP